MSVYDQSRRVTQAGLERLSDDTAGAAPETGAPRPQLAFERRHIRLPRPVEPFELLLAERAAFPLLGREAEISALQAWLGSSPPVSARCLSGPGGIGKTRLALALCEWAEVNGWSAGFAEADALTDVRVSLNAAPLRGPVLLVLEEPRDAIAGLSEWLADAGSRAMRNSRLRLLLLAREARAGGLWLDELARVGVIAEPPRPVCLSGLAAPAGSALFARALDEAERLTNRSRPKSSLLTIPAAASPLHLILAGLAGARLGPGQALINPAASLAQDVASIERSRLERVAASCFLPSRLMTHFAACVTLQAGSALDQAVVLVEDEASAMGFHLPLPPDQVADCLADALLSDCGTAIAPIRPEVVGGAFVVAELGCHSAEVQEAIVSRALNRGGSATSRMLRGMVAEHAGSDPAHPSRAWARVCSGVVSRQS